MSDDQYLSTDPKAGTPIPSAPDHVAPTIANPTMGAHPEARMSAARPGGAPWQTEIARPGDVRLERDREDNNVLGMPPELAVTSAIPVARAVAGAGASLASKAVAAAGAAAPQIAAQAKYWGTKAVLMKMGVPSTIAEGIALVASGLKKGAPKGEPPAGEVAPGAAEAVPPPASSTPSPVAAPGPVVPAGASVPAAGAPPVPSGAPPAAPPPTPAPGAVPPPPVSVANSLPDQKALNEAAIAARRPAYQARVAQMETAAPVAETPVPPSSAKPSLLASEAKEYMKLIQSGKTAKQALDLIVAQRGLAKLPGAMSDADVAAEIAARVGNRSPKR